MAHFAVLNSDSVVTDIVVIDNDEILDEEGVEQESLGIARCQELFGTDNTYVQTSYNYNIRHKYASIGDTYDATADIFKPQKPWDNWVWSDTEVDWIPPVAKPEGDDWHWKHDTNEWVQGLSGLPPL